MGTGMVDRAEREEGEMEEICRLAKTPLEMQRAEEIFDFAEGAISSGSSGLSVESTRMFKSLFMQPSRAIGTVTLSSIPLDRPFLPLQHNPK